MSEQEKLSSLPVLPLRDVVVYPHMVLPQRISTVLER